jgi:predicted GNAT family N-acyltransferase
MITNNYQPLFKVIVHGSPEYLEAVRLREDILRKPLGLTFLPEELLGEKDHIQIAGFLDGMVISTAVLVPEGGECKLQRVVVKQELQALGIGSKMMAFCEGYAKGQGFGSIYCHARDMAVSFYLKNRYVAEGDYFDEDTIPHLKMRKVL